MLRVASELKRTKTTRVSVHEEDLGSLAHALIHARVAIELKRTTRVSEHEEDLVKPGCAV